MQKLRFKQQSPKEINSNLQQGVSLYLSILIMAIVLALALGTSSLLTGQLKTAKEMKNSIKAFYAAESGIERLLHENSVSSLPVGWSTGDVSINGATYKANTAGCGVFQSRGKFGGTQRAIEQRVSPSKMVFAAQVANGDLGGTDGADNICQSRAKSAGLAGNYKSWLSGADSAVAPANTFSQPPVAYFNLDCATVANNWSDLTDGSILNPISRGIDETGNIIPISSGFFIFTNTNANGSQTASGLGVTCNDWTSISGNAKSGKTLEITSVWTQSGIDRSCNSPNYIYCFEQ